MKKGGKNFKKQVEVLKRVYQKVSRIRKDFLHKQSRKLANEYATVIREDLNISKMVKDSRYAKHILDCSWGTFFELLEYKTDVIKVNCAYTSQECSKCGHTSKENRKTQSLFECVSCGFTENADLQACFNILQRGQTLLEANVEQQFKRFPRIQPTLVVGVVKWRKGLLDDYEFEDLGWIDNGYPEFTLFGTCPWYGEGTEENLVSGLFERVWWEGEVDENYHPISKYPTYKDVIECLKKLPTVRIDNKINSKLIVRYDY